MEPGSRSPLPPSHHQNHSDNDLSQGAHLIREFLSSNDSLNNVQTSLASSTASSPTIKHIPSKPPRKSIATSDQASERLNKSPVDMSLPSMQLQKFTKYQDYEPVALSDAKGPPSTLMKTPPPLPTSPIPSNSSSKSLLKMNDLLAGASSPMVDLPPQLPVRNESMSFDDRNYERIESISNAWKTLGVSDVKHTEHTKASKDDLIEPVWQRSQSQKDKKKTPKALNAYRETDGVSSTANADDGNYDKLEFFATKHNVSNDYRTIVTISSPTFKKQTSQPVTSNDYEIIGDSITPEPKAYRLADDSYMGYGILRKPAAAPNEANHTSPNAFHQPGSASPNPDQLLNHWNVNGVEYSICSKSKHV